MRPRWATHMVALIVALITIATPLCLIWAVYE
jgi:hypothetical protein